MVITRLTTETESNPFQPLVLFSYYWAQPPIQHSTTTTDQMTIISSVQELFIIILFHWGLVKWICRLFLGHLVIDREDCEKLSCFSPKSGPQIQLSTTTRDRMATSSGQELFIILLIH
jgi:hypothetical protein